MIAKYVNQMYFSSRMKFDLGQLTMPKKESSYGNHQRTLSSIPTGMVVSQITMAAERTTWAWRLHLVAVGMTTVAPLNSLLSVKSYSLVRNSSWMVWTCLV
jgi:hypothetical protein